MITPLSKVIDLKFNLNETNKSLLFRTATGKQFNTTDTDAWLQIEFTDTNIQSGTYNLTLINLKDHSKFEHEGIAFNSNPFYYKLDSGADMLKNEIKHAGTWIGQLVVTLDNGQSTTQQFIFDIESHILDGEVASVTMLEGYSVLIAQINAAKALLDQYNIDYAALLADLEATYNSRLFSVEQQLEQAALFKKAKTLVPDCTFTRGYDNKIIAATGTDNTSAFQSIANELQTRIRTDEFGAHDNVLVIPNGVYYFTGKVTISPIIRLKPMGTVLFVFDGVGEFLVLECGNEPGFYKEMWQRGSIIDGSNGGLTLQGVTDVGIIRTGTKGLVVGNSVADLTVFSRYTINDIGIGGFGVGLNLKGFDHYIGNFDCVHLEGNITNILVDNLQDNFGEAFTFYKCVFAGSQDVLYMHSAFDVVFDNCHFDYNQRIIKFDPDSAGYATIRYSSCYFERIYDCFAYGDGGGLGNNTKPQIIISDAVIYTNRKTLFKCGARGYSLHMHTVEFRYTLSEASRKATDIFMVDITNNGKIEVYYSDIIFSRYGAWQIIDGDYKTSLNFANGVVGNGLVDNSVTITTLPNITLVSKGTITDAKIVNSQFLTGTTSLMLKGLSDASWIEFRCEDKIPVGYNDKIFIQNIHKVIDAGVNGTIAPSFVIELYDEANALIQSVAITTVDKIVGLSTWYPSYSFVQGSITTAEHTVKKANVRYAKIKCLYGNFVEMYLEQIAVNVIKS